MPIIDDEDQKKNLAEKLKADPKQIKVNTKGEVAKPIREKRFKGLDGALLIKYRNFYLDTGCITNQEGHLLPYEKESI